MDRKQVEALETELVALRKRTQLVEDKLNEVEFGDMSAKNGVIEVEFRPRRHAAILALAHSLVDTLGSATNYVCIPITTPTGERLEGSVQRVAPGKITPHEGRVMAENEVKRLLAVCLSAGINESTTIVVAGAPIPEPPASRPAADPADKAPWCRLDISESPNAFFCERCGDRMILPPEKTARMMKAMVDVFHKEHETCVETGATHDEGDDE
jgi:hypothetical protein